MPSEFFFCPRCKRQLTKSAAAFVLGEMKYGVVLGDLPPTVTCPGCGAAIDAKAMIEGRYDAPPVPVGSLLFVGLIALAVGGYYWKQHADESWRNANAFNKRFYYAEDSVAWAEREPTLVAGRLASALAYYEMAARGLEDEYRERAAQRAQELEARLPALVGPWFLHQDFLLSPASPMAELCDRDGAVVGKLRLRETEDGAAFEIDFTPTLVADGTLRQIEGKDSMAHQPSREHMLDREASVRVLIVPRGGPDPELTGQGYFRFNGVDGEILSETEIDLWAVPTEVAPDQPTREVRSGTPAVRIHAVRLGRG